MLVMTPRMSGSPEVGAVSPPLVQAPRSASASPAASTSAAAFARIDRERVMKNLVLSSAFTSIRETDWIGAEFRCEQFG